MVINVLKSFMGVMDFMAIVDNPTTDPNCIGYSNNQCQACRNGLVIVNSTCQGCLPGFYLVNDTVNGTLKCDFCPENCLGCKMGNNNQIQCTACR